MIGELIYLVLMAAHHVAIYRILRSSKRIPDERHRLPDRKDENEHAAKRQL